MKPQSNPVTGPLKTVQAVSTVGNYKWVGSSVGLHQTIMTVAKHFIA